MAKRRQTRRMSRRSKKYSRKMRGGALDEQELLGLGFTAEQINALHGYGIDNMNLNNMNFEQGPGLEIQDLGPYSPQSVTEEPYGGRRIRKSRKSKLRRSGRRMRSVKRGGACYGNGVGANAFDPNYSIYNTRELQLFPYRPN